MTTRVARVSLRTVAKSWHSADSRFELDVPSLDLHAGEVRVLTGPNGTGKTTLLELLGLASQPSSGHIEFVNPGGKTSDVSALWKTREFGALARLRAQAFGYVLQSIHLLPFLSVRGNAELAQQISGRPDTAHIKKLLAILGLTGREDALPGTLSPGLRQRAAIARALAHKPLFVIADEPTASLDPEGGAAVVSLLMRLAHEDGAAVVLSTHQHSAETAIPNATAIQTRPLAASESGIFRAVVEVDGA